MTFRLKNFTHARYGTTTKEVGETPLVALERFRLERKISVDTPLAYAGRLDPMASGKLLILIGDECKVQEKYHSFDKEYEVELLLDVSSDTGDVLGLLTLENTTPSVSLNAVEEVCMSVVGDVTLPYPHFSSKTVAGKPLHTWTLENRLNEIVIPLKTSHIHTIKVHSIKSTQKSDILEVVCEKIETIPQVTDVKKALGADFRREKVRDSWDEFGKNGNAKYQIVSFTCVASSGTYMRSLCEHIAEKLGTRGLAYSIHRTKIGTYRKVLGTFGIWTRSF